MPESRPTASWLTPEAQDPIYVFTFLCSDIIAIVQPHLANLAETSDRTQNDIKAVKVKKTWVEEYFFQRPEKPAKKEWTPRCLIKKMPNDAQSRCLCEKVAPKR